MILGSFNKQSAEVLDYDIDYSDWIDTTGDHVQSAAVTATPSDLVIDSVFVNDPRLKIWLAGGTSGTQYLIEVLMTSADGRIKRDEFKLKVKDI